MDITSVEEIKQARPFIRSVVALLVFMRTGPAVNEGDLKYHYKIADAFLEEFEADLDRAVQRPVSQVRRM